jgi:hypothetical protein
MTDYNKSQSRIRQSPHPSARTLEVREEEREKSKSIIKDFRSVSEEHQKSALSKEEKEKADSELVIELKNRISELTDRISELEERLK